MNGSKLVFLIKSNERLKCLRFKREGETKDTDPTVQTSRLELIKDKV